MNLFQQLFSLPSSHFFIALLFAIPIFILQQYIFLIMKFKKYCLKQNVKRIELALAIHVHFYLIVVYSSEKNVDGINFHIAFYGIHFDFVD